MQKEPGAENLDSPSIASIKQEAPGDEEEDEDEDEEAEEEEASELRAGEPGDSAVPETEGQVNARRNHLKFFHEFSNICCSLMFDNLGCG